MTVAKQTVLSLILFALPLQAAEPEIRDYLAKPSRRAARALVARGHAVLPSLAAEFPSQPEAGKLALLKAILALPESAERTDFLVKTAGDKAEPSVIAIAAPMAELLAAPADRARQDALVQFTVDRLNSDGFKQFEFSFFGDRGRVVLQHLVDRLDSLSSSMGANVATALAAHFPQEASEALMPWVEKLSREALADPSAADAKEEMVKALLPSISDLDLRSSFVKTVLADATLNPQGSLRESLSTEAVIATPGEMTKEMASSLSSFYCNPDTAPQGDTETEAHANLRRYRLIALGQLLHRLQRAGARGVEVAGALVRRNAAFLGAAKDCPELRANVATVVAQMADPAAALEPIMVSDKPEVLIAGMEFMRRVPVEKWRGNAGFDFRGRILRLAQFSVPSIPDAVRLEAAATYQYMNGSTRDSYAALLPGLGSKEKADRIKTIGFLAGAPESVELTEALVHIVGADPEADVRIAALNWIEKVLEADLDIGRVSVYAESRQMGENIFMCRKFKNSKLTQAADAALEEYLKQSPYADGLLEKARKSAIPEIATRAVRLSNERGASKIWSLIATLKALPRTPLDKLDPYLTDSLKSLEFQVQQDLSALKP